MDRRALKAPTLSLDFGLLSNFERIIDFDAEISHRAFQLGMPEQGLDGSKIVNPALDQSCLGSAHGMRSIDLWIKADGFDPGFDKPGILSGRQVLAGTHSAWKQKSAVPMTHHLQPCFDGIAGWLRNLELNGPTGHFLDNNGSGSNSFAVPDIGEFDRNQIAATQLAVDGEIKECQVAFPPIKLEPNAHGPDILAFQRWSGKFGHVAKVQILL